MTTITGSEVREIVMPLLAPFAVAKRTAYEARNVLIALGADDGLVGLGAGVPVEYVTGETVVSVIAGLDAAAPQLIGQRVDRLWPLLNRAAELLPDQPTARAALEMALYDIWAKRRNLPLWHYFGAALNSLTSDITIPIVSAEVAAQTARAASDAGFAAFKIKVGDPDGVDADIARIAAVAHCQPSAKIRIDANQAFDAKGALGFIREVLRICPGLDLVEQPTPASDIDALCEVRSGLAGAVAVYADESVMTVQSAAELIRREAVDGINVKIMKSGVVGAWRIAALCNAHRVGLMLGCMLESQLPLAAACALAAGTGWFARIDLDSHRLLAPSEIFRGGFVDNGPILTPGRAEPGWGVTFHGPEGNKLAPMGV